MRIKSSSVILLKQGILTDLFTFTSDREACAHFSMLLGKFSNKFTLEQGFDLAQDEGYWQNDTGIELLVRESD